MLTSDLSKFGTRELSKLHDILDAWIFQGLPEDFESWGNVVPMFNQDTGLVFLTNSAKQIAIFNGESLEIEKP